MKKNVYFFLGISASFNIILVSIFAYKIYNNWFETTVLKSEFRENIFAAAPLDTGKIYFIGDSDIEAFELNEFLQNDDVRNRGIWGDVSGNVIKRLDNIFRQRPRSIFLMIGQNDVCSGIKNESIVANVDKFIRESKASLPEAKLYILSELPTDQPILYSKEKAMYRIDKLNDSYKHLAEKYHVTYIDLYHNFVQGKGLNKKYYFKDGSHLNGTGYLLFAKLLKPYVNS